MPFQRRKTTCVSVGSVCIGGGCPIVIQSMTDTRTADIQATVVQIVELVKAGSELVRITVNDDDAARAIPEIHRLLVGQGASVPLIGDFHFNGHLLLTRHPEMAAVLSKYRINPGNLGQGRRRDEHFEAMIRVAVKNRKPVRIGVNSGSLDQELLAGMMDRNACSDTKKTERVVFCEAMVESAMQSTRAALELGLGEDQIVLSAKTSDLQDLLFIYQALAAACPFPLHLGLTEAGSQEEGVIASTAAVSILLQQGIGDTLRISLTPDQHAPRAHEVEVARQILQSLGIRHFRPRVVSCPGCGRTSSTVFQKLAQSVKGYVAARAPQWEQECPGSNQMTIAVMGCVVNGPGESKDADIGISLPGDRESLSALVYIRGKQTAILEGNDIGQQFLVLLEEFVQASYKKLRQMDDEPFR